MNISSFTQKKYNKGVEIYQWYLNVGAGGPGAGGNGLGSGLLGP